MTVTSDAAKGNIGRSPKQMGFCPFNERPTRLGVRAYPDRYRDGQLTLPLT